VARSNGWPTSGAGSPSGSRPRSEWVEVAVRAGEIAPITGAQAFAGFFALYFGVLVAGLRGELDRDTRPVVLRAL
jgi:hypothetical protein